MIVAIIGSRKFDDYIKFKLCMQSIIEVKDITKIISGGAVGADTLAEMYAKENDIEIEVIKPEWSIGKFAGMLRNTDIVNKADMVVAFWDMESKGTKDSITKAKKLGKKLIVFSTIKNQNKILF